MRWVVLAGLIALPILAWVFPARSHTHWINDGRYRSPVDGMLCCGEHDCAVIPPDEVKITPTGYHLINVGDVVPFSEAIPSEDGQFHRCHKPDGSRRCFFAPQQGM